MSMSIEVPKDLQPAIAAAVAKGEYANEQELVSDILRAAVPVLETYQRLRRDIQTSLNQIEHGEIREADFDTVRRKLCSEYDDSGNRK